MNNRRLPFVAILASIVFFFAFTSRASAGYVPNRPAGVTLKTFSGVLDAYGYGNHFGGFSLTNGSKVTTFCLGAPMHMNGKIITCRDPAIP